MKKALIIGIIALIVAVLAIGVFSTTASAASTEGYYTYTVKEGEATITDVNTSISGDVTIPSTLGGYPVTNIGIRAFKSCNKLTSIFLPSSIKIIENSAFEGCAKLTSITLPNNIVSIGSTAFYNTAYYNDANNWEDDVLYIGMYLIKANATKSGVYSIKEGTSLIADYAFYGCDSLTSISIPDTITSIGNSAFNNCINLTNIEVSDRITYIGTHTFYNTAYYNNTDNWEDDALYIGNYLIKVNTSKSGEYSIKKGTTLIADEAFDVNTSSISVSVPEGVTSIGNKAFMYCSNLTSISIPYSVKNIGDYAFYQCSNLKKVYYNGTSKDWTNIAIGSSNQSLLDANITYLAEYFTYTVTNDEATITDVDTAISGDITIPSKLGGYPVTTIGESAFFNCKGLKSIIIPNSVTTIVRGAFFYCEGLQSITIPNSVTTIGNSTFYACTSLKSVTIPDGITSIGDSAFYYCTSLTSVTIPDSVTTIGNKAFSGCEKLTSITISDSVTSIGEYAFENCKWLKSVIIGNSVTTIGEYAFKNCSSLNSVYITDMEKWCNIDFVYFSSNPLGYANNLYLNGELVTDLIIPDGITSIGEYTFEDCTSLTSVTIPDSVTKIYTYAFADCTSLTSVTIPLSVTSIDYRAFYGCLDLETVYYNGTENDWKKITIDVGNQPLVNAEIITPRREAIENTISGTTLTTGVVDGETVIIVPSNNNIAMTESELAAIFNDESITITSNNGIIGTGCKVTIGEYEVDLVVKGDVDGDGVATVFDALMVKKALANNGFENEALREFAADVDSTAGTTEADVSFLLSLIVA